MSVSENKFLHSASTVFIAAAVSHFDTVQMQEGKSGYLDFWMFAAILASK